MTEHGGDGRGELAPVIPLFGAPEPDSTDRSTRIEQVAERLRRRLRTRQLSIAEARGVLAEADLDAHDAAGVLDDFVRLGYLDDAALAAQLVHICVDRKAQGRHAAAQTLARRGIPRDVADAALTDLADDDLARALAFARGRAPAMARLDRDAALRRLSGQLARRGYPGSLALQAARQALDEGA